MWWRHWHVHSVCVRSWKRICTTHTYIRKSSLVNAFPNGRQPPKDGHNLFYNRLVSAQVENVTTYLCWQHAIPERAINRCGLTAVPSASRAPSTSTPPTSSLKTSSSFSTLSPSLWLLSLVGFSLNSVTYQRFGHQLLYSCTAQPQRSRFVSLSLMLGAVSMQLYSICKHSFIDHHHLSLFTLT